MASTPPEADSATAEAPTDHAPAEPRFFRWLRSLGLVRRSGWLGGVCAAIAERIRLDPILVRGIVVVLAVLGAPVVLVYAAAWFLLPDEKGAIHALTLSRGRVESAVVAIAGLVLLSFLPLTQGFWWTGAAYWGEPDFAASAGRILWTGLVIVVAIVVVVWLARRAAHPDIRTVPATTDDKPDTVPAEGAPAPADVVASVDAVVADATVAPSPPPPPTAGASDAELAAWRSQQDEWRRQRSAWAARQRVEDRAHRAAAQAVWAQERQARLDARRRREPSIGGAVVGVVLGLAIVAGCIVGLVVGIAHPDRPVGPLAGLGAAVVVFGVALAIAGLARRRAGALAAFAILALAGALVAMPFVSNRTLIPGPTGGYGVDTTHDGRYLRFAGTTEFTVFQARRPKDTVVDLWQRTGAVHVVVQPGLAVRVVATLPDGGLDTVSWTGGVPSHRHPVASASRSRGVHRYDMTYGRGPVALTLRITLETGTVSVGPDLGFATEGDSATAAPTPSPTRTEGAQP